MKRKKTKTETGKKLILGRGIQHLQIKVSSSQSIHSTERIMQKLKVKKKSYPDKKTSKLMFALALSCQSIPLPMTYLSQHFDVGESSSQFSQHNSWPWKHKGEEKPLANASRRFNIFSDLLLAGFLVQSRRLFYGF